MHALANGLQWELFVLFCYTIAAAGCGVRLFHDACEPDMRPDRMSAALESSQTCHSGHA